MTDFRHSLDAALARSRETDGGADLEALVEALRSSPNGPWLVLPGPIDMTPGFARTILASDWLAAHDAQITAAAERAVGERIAQAIEAEATRIRNLLPPSPINYSHRVAADALDDAAAIARSVPATEAGEVCVCGSPDAYSLTPGEVIVHRTDGPCYIAKSDATEAAPRGESS